MEDIKNLDYSNEEIFEPDFEFSDDLQAINCLCGISSGSGSGPTKP